MSDHAPPVDAIAAWANKIAFVREDGMQVTYSERSIPEVKRLHDEMLRSLLAWHRRSLATGR